MAKKYSQLPAAGTVDGTDIVAVVQKGQTRKLLVSTLLQPLAPIGLLDVALSDNWIDAPLIHGRTGSIDQGAGTASANITRIEAATFGAVGYLRSVDVYANASGPAILKILKDVGGNKWDVLYSFPVMLSVGLNALTNTKDFSLSESVQADWSFGFYSASAVFAFDGSVPGVGRAYTAGEALGNGVTFTASNSFMQWRATIYAGATVKEQAAQLATDVAALKVPDGELRQYGKVPEATGTFTNNSSTRLFAWDLPGNAQLSKIRLRVNTAGVIKFKILNRRTNGNFNVVDEFSVSALAAGLSEFVAGISFPVIDMPDKGAIGVYSTVAKVEYETGGAGSNLYFVGDAAGDDVAFLSASSLLEAQIDLIVQDVPLQMPRTRTLIDEPFTNDKNLIATGVWDFSGDGALSPDGGDSLLYRTEYTTLDPVVTRARFRLEQTDASFGICRKPAETSFGTLAVLNCAANRLELYPWDGATVGSIARQAAAGLTYVIGREYLLELEHRGGVNKLTVRDCVTQQTATLSAENGDGSSDTGRSWGNPGVIVRSGLVRAIRLQYASLQVRNPRVLFVGDSITEGFNLGASWPDRMVTRFATESDRTMVVAARGASDSADVLARADMDILAWRPDYFYLLMGTNERGSVGNLATWKANLEKILAMARSVGAQIVMGTLPPNSTGMDFITAANAYIKASGFGDGITVVDHAQVLSLGNDGITLNTDLFLADLTHPNSAGHALMLGQLRGDAPMLFD